MASPKAALAFTHKARLVSRDRTQEVRLVVDATSLTILSAADTPGEAAPIAKIGFPFVHKVCKASERSRSPGPPRMLDVVIHSRKGLRDLRIDLGHPIEVRTRSLSQPIRSRRCRSDMLVFARTVRGPIPSPSLHRA